MSAEGQEQGQGRIVLGSRSPQRRELLGQIVAPGRIEVLPPASAGEQGFAGVTDEPAIHERLGEIVREKARDVRLQLGAQRRAAGMAAVVCADTVIAGINDDGTRCVLEQPPEENWQQTVRDWFLRFYLGRTHSAITAVHVVTGLGRVCERVVESQVTFHTGMESRLEDYLATGESRGKAGGYALQGEGGDFVEQVEGSISNVIGLPLEALLEMFEELGVDVG